MSQAAPHGGDDASDAAGDIASGGASWGVCAARVWFMSRSEPDPLVVRGGQPWLSWVWFGRGQVVVGGGCDGVVAVWLVGRFGVLCCRQTRPWQKVATTLPHHRHNNC